MVMYVLGIWMETKGETYVLGIWMETKGETFCTGCHEATRRGEQLQYVLDITNAMLCNAV